MDQEAAPGAPAGCRSSSTSPISGMWDCHQIGADPAAFCADPSSSSENMRLTNHLWNQTVLSMGAPGSRIELYGHGEDFVSLLVTRNLTTPEILEDVPEAACDYLKGMDGGGSMARSATCGLDSVGQYEIASSPLMYQVGNTAAVQGSMGCIPCYHHESQRGSNQHQELGTPINAFLQQTFPTVGSGSLDYYGWNREVCPESRAMEASFDCRSLPDGSNSFSNYKSNAKLPRIHDQLIVPERTSRSSVSDISSDPKKRKSGERLAGSGKKSKQDYSDTSSSVAQEKEKIAELQQTVCPFGKTDRASVLFETIQHIKLLHEQIQEHIQLGSEEEKTGLEHDLMSRGLCLVPVSWIPHVYRDNSIPENMKCLYG